MTQEVGSQLDAALASVDDDDDRAPICPSCGVTALPSETGAGFVCEHPDCPAYGDLVS